MVLSRKDVTTTILAAGVGVLTYAKYQNWLVGPRLGILVLGIVGITMCALGSKKVPNDSAWFIDSSLMAGLALMLVILGLITGSSLVFYLLAANIGALWLFTTLRHARGN